jgi:hypothetical protein
MLAGTRERGELPSQPRKLSLVVYRRRYLKKAVGYDVDAAEERRYRRTNKMK